MIDMKWQIAENVADEGLKACVGDLLAKLLVARGVTTAAQATQFLNPLDVELLPPSVFLDMPHAILRLQKAIEKQEHILIWGDFDADGVSSTALLHKTFKKLGAKFSHFIPEREAHGHGLHSGEIVKLIAKHKVKVVVTVDCGISNIKQTLLLKGLKVDVIITDHHKAENELPEAYAILNPLAQGALSPDLSVENITSLCNLAGVGVAHKLAAALLAEFKIEDKILEDELLALVAIGTISDVVPLLGENRALVARGLKCLNAGAIVGATALFKECSKTTEITSTDVAFILSPRINAAGRLSTACEAFNLLTETNAAKLNISIEQLNNNNRIRQSLCDNTFAQALEMAGGQDGRAIMLFNPDWHLGIVGIVASRLVEKFNKPVFLSTLDSEGVGRCSARGVLGYSIYEIMRENEELFLGYGGHTLAGGFSYESEEHSFDELKAAILKSFDECDAPDTGSVLEIDAELEANDINKELLAIISKLEPCGQKNPSPVFCLNGAVLTSFNFVGQGGAHLKYVCTKDGQKLDCVWWQKSKEHFDIPQGAELDIAFTPRLNEFRGVQTVQLETVSAAVRGKSADNIKFYDHRQKVLEDILPSISEYLSNPALSLIVVAHKSSTLAQLEPYAAILKRVSSNIEPAQALMFFDYPPSKEAFEDILAKSGATKIHLMREEFEDDINFYLKKLSGMLKYIHGKKGGVLELGKVTHELGLTEAFVRCALNIFVQMNVVKKLSGGKISYVKPVVLEKISENALYGALVDEFDKIAEFKNTL
jgi:single-stranded-DNA-specific exonuclease